jgi:hypothetical protein
MFMGFIDFLEGRTRMGAIAVIDCEKDDTPQVREAATFFVEPPVEVECKLGGF